MMQSSRRYICIFDTSIHLHISLNFLQMVSTPIGPPSTEQQTPTVSIQTPSPIKVPYLMTAKPSISSHQPTYPYSTNILTSIPDTQSQHTFSVFYDRDVSSATSPSTEMKPSSLYTEYIQNPYNISSVRDPRHECNTSSQILKYQTSCVTETNTQQDFNTFHELPNSRRQDLGIIGNVSKMGADVEDLNDNIDNRPTNESSVLDDNMFQSSNYFQTDTCQNFFPPGSDILFGTNINQNSNISSKTVPVQDDL